MKLSNTRAQRALMAGLTFLAAVLFVASCSTERDRATTALFDGQFVTTKAATQDLPFTFQNGDSAFGWFQVSDGRKIDFLVLDTQDLKNVPHDTAHARAWVVQATVDSFKVGFPVGGNKTFEFIDRDTLPAQVRFYVAQVYWVAVKGSY